MSDSLISQIQSADYDLEELLNEERTAWTGQTLARTFEHRCEQFRLELDLSRTGLIAGPLHLWVESGFATTESPSGLRNVAEAFVDLHTRHLEMLGAQAEAVARRIYDERYDAKVQQHRAELLKLELASLERDRVGPERKAFEEVQIRLDMNSVNPRYAIGFIPDEYDPSKIMPTGKDDSQDTVIVFDICEDAEKEDVLSFTDRNRFSVHGRYVHVVPADTKSIVLMVESEALRKQDDALMDAKEDADQRAKEITVDELKAEMNDFKFTEAIVADLVPQINLSMLNQARAAAGAALGTGTVLEGLTGA